MSGSCAIPLAITAPAAVKLLGWAFADFNNQPIADPVCFLVLECPDELLLSGSSVWMRTHIRDLRITLCNPAGPLSCEEVSILAKLVVADLSPLNALRLSSLLPFLGAGLDGIPGDSGAVELEVLSEAGTLVATGLDFVPSHMLMRTTAGYVYRAIVNIRIRSGLQTTLELKQPPSRDTGRFDRAILIGTGRHAVAQIARKS